MTGKRIQRALISVYDKTGVVELARSLHDEFGIEILSTGGTAALLAKNGVSVTLVEDVTGFPELMDGRVKTLHPRIHAAILADRDNPEHMQQLQRHGIQPIDLVVVNLYPFEKTIADPSCTLEQAIEMIDIGGPCLLRAAAKNHQHVLVVSRSDRYELLLSLLRKQKKGTMDWEQEYSCYALAAFRDTASYDAAITRWLGRHDADDSSVRVLELSSRGRLRYGENPHQSAELLGWHEFIRDEAILDRSNPQDESQCNMSLNNYADGHAALELCKELTRELGSRAAREQEAVCVFIKHANPCGVGMATDPIEAYRRAYLGDPKAAMGGILACNVDVNAEFAEAVMTTYSRWGKEAGAGGFFVEVWIAPSFEAAAMKVIRGGRTWGKRVRLLPVGDMCSPPNASKPEYKSITGGLLAQSRDLVGLNEAQWNVVTKRSPSDAETNDLRLAWICCKHTKSNAITICKDHRLLGNGAGQMSRVMSCRIAVWLAGENGHAGRLRGSAAASDAFFPFPDGPEILLEAGVTAIIQPGGSKRDGETIALCDKNRVAMILTGTRHFRH